MPPFPAFDGSRVAIVGNAREIGDRGRAIDAADCVVRFNNACGFGGAAGSRVTVLALVNRGGQARAWVEDGGFLDRPVVRQSGGFLLPFPELAPDEEGAHERVCWTAPLQGRLVDRPVRLLPSTLHDRARHLLVARGCASPNPSTGFLVALAVLEDRAACLPPIDVYGFGFAGWAGHPWEAERAWFEAGHAAGRLRLHPLAAT
ncbi:MULTISPECIES: hypothetical protein [unclassified Methylobacterium]|uniref:hypothetical protein n=1 Tax=unclassified Methylobacterium TaxID=2615210 RepID=UPI0006FF2623|nr:MULTISPECIES: hypothetical protein [unclassified Methylobacterium]KQP52553.1 hypothetical protein ASF39_06430 [Methylobacterium sp. Leaf108]KQT84265.1 hypothetical protein ASG59_02405 [Methylobacterium sp. Leaf466]